MRFVKLIWLMLFFIKSHTFASLMLVNTCIKFGFGICDISRIALAVCFCVITFKSSAQSCDVLIGRWMNQDSSIMSILSDVDGQIQGHYQSNASDDANLFPFTGLVNREGVVTTFAFAISWGEYGSITSWTGHCVETENDPELITLWHLVRPYAEYDWERFVTNKSIFTAIP